MCGLWYVLVPMTYYLSVVLVLVDNIYGCLLLLKYTVHIVQLGYHRERFGLLMSL